MLVLPAFGVSVAQGLGVVFGLAVSVFFELVKNAAYTNFFIGLYKFKNAALSGLAAMVVLSVLSVGSSFVGSTLLPTVAMSDTLRHDFSSFDAQKKELNAQIKAAQAGSTYKGILTKQGHAQISKIQNELDNLAKERAKYSELIDTEKAVFAQEKTSITSYLGYFSLASELVYIACYAFSVFYLYRFYVELQIDSSANPEQIPTKFHEIHNKANPDAQARPTPMHSGTPNPTPHNPPNVGTNQPANPNPEPPTQPRKIGFILGENLGTPNPTPEPNQTANPDALRHSGTTTPMHSGTQDTPNPDAQDTNPDAQDTNPDAQDTPNPDAIISKYGIGKCDFCGSKFHKNSYNHKFCSDTCKLDFHEKKHGKKFVPRKK
jgi:hypothetical protein